jgi:hypothetical protein
VVLLQGRSRLLLLLHQACSLLMLLQIEHLKQHQAKA